MNSWRDFDRVQSRALACLFWAAQKPIRCQVSWLCVGPLALG